VLIYGASSDKDIDGMLASLLSISKRVIVTRSYHPRAASPADLAYKCATSGADVEITMDLQSALTHAQPYLTRGWGIICTGSVFVVADMREAWADEHDLELPMGDWVDEPW
jgi:folylpolyglutamate synthase/dihydropteroate synthase